MIMLQLSACGVLKHNILHSLGGYEDYVYFSYGKFQDFTNYGKYYYSSVALSGNKYFKQIHVSDMKNIDTYLDDYEGWIDSIKEAEPTNELIVNYDFDREIIDTEDYFFIRSDQETSDSEITLHNYELFVLDSQSLVLYYFRHT